MKTLFIDTHSEKVTIKIKLGDEIITEEQTSDRSHSEIAIPTIEKALQKAQIELKDLDEIIVVNGPGSFTGVRIGVTIAKTMAFELGIPIKTITSLEAYSVSSDEIHDLTTVQDSKGVYSALCIEGEFKDFKYQRKADFDAYVESHNYTILKNHNLDLDKIIAYLEKKETLNPHLVNPIYIKEIDVLK